MGSSADLEVGDTAGLETCATTDHQFESHSQEGLHLRVPLKVVSVSANEEIQLT
jgi:hypothetical protein